MQRSTLRNERHCFQSQIIGLACSVLEQVW